MSKTDISLSALRTKIADLNAEYLGIDITELMDVAGAGIAEKIIKKYGKSRSIAVICGLGNNGGNGLATANHLVKSGYKGQISVYLVGRPGNIHTTAAQNHWNKLKQLESFPNIQNLTLVSDISAPDIKNHELIVEALLGTGIRGNIKKRFRDIISRCTHFRQTMIAIDVPAPGYTWDLSVSIMYPKTADAQVVDIGMPDQVEMYAGPGEVAALTSVNKTSHKSQNGKVLIICNSLTDQNLIIIEAASTYVGEVMVYSIEPTQLKKIKSHFAEIRIIESHDLEQAVQKSHSILLCSDLELNLPTKSLIVYMINNYLDPKYLLDKTVYQEIKSDIVNQPKVLLFDTTSGASANSKRYCVDNSVDLVSIGSKQMVVAKNIFTDKIDMKLSNPATRLTSIDILKGLSLAYTSTNNNWIGLSAAVFVANAVNKDSLELASDLT